MKTILSVAILFLSAAAAHAQYGYRPSRHWSNYPIYGYGHDYPSYPMQRYTIYGNGTIQSYRVQQEPDFGFGESYRVYSPDGGIYRIRRW